ncbi:prefoldin subunit 1 [Arctopsyche grandis]|uniref:prefoldin subunit 1 n=1 Tax=Arctopsyche grandis TaxID=121162 RepID=UPI00406D6BD5
MSAADAELRQAFAQLQAQMVETQQRVSALEPQMAGLQRAQLHADATLQQLALAGAGGGGGGGGAENRAYQPVGRAFLLQPLPELKAAAADRRSNADAKLEALKTMKDYLERTLKNSENNLREMVQQRKEQASS